MGLTKTLREKANRNSSLVVCMHRHVGLTKTLREKANRNIVGPRDEQLDPLTKTLREKANRNCSAEAQRS